MNQGRDTAGVIAPPPVIYLIGLVAGLVADWLYPLGIGPGGLAPPTQWLAGAIVILSALALAGAAIWEFRRVGTNVPTYRPTTALVIAGPYRRTRNPIYIALSLLFAGIAVAADNGWLLIALVPILAVMNWGVVAREDAYLEAKFGEDYRAYKRRVRRWL